MEKMVEFLENEDIIKEKYKNSGTNRKNIQSTITQCIAPYVEDSLRKKLENRCFVFFVDGWSDK